METCNAHAALVDNIARLRDSTGEIYGLLRKTTDEIGEANVRIATIEISQRLGFEAIQSQLHEYEKQTESISSAMTKMNADLLNAIEIQKQRRWTPQAIITLIGTIVGSSGISALAIFLKG